MSRRSAVPALALLGSAALALAACGGGRPEPTNTGAGVNIVEAPASPPPVENAVAVRPAPVETAADRRRAARDARDGPGEEQGPEYEGARSAATALPSQGDDAATTDATPPPPPPPPNSTGPQG